MVQRIAVGVATTRARARWSRDSRAHPRRPQARAETAFCADASGERRPGPQRRRPVHRSGTTAAVPIARLGPCHDCRCVICTVGYLLLDVIVRTTEPLARGADSPVETRLASGGQAANVAAWAASLGAPARFVGKQAGDE